MRVGSTLRVACSRPLLQWWWWWWWWSCCGIICWSVIRPERDPSVQHFWIKLLVAIEVLLLDVRFSFSYLSPGVEMEKHLLFFVRSIVFINAVFWRDVFAGRPQWSFPSMLCSWTQDTEDARGRNWTVFWTQSRLHLNITVNGITYDSL